MIKSGLGKSFEDDGDIQISKSKFLGRVLQTVESLVPYGTFGTPMKNVRQILLSLRANESNIAAINSDSANRIKRNTKPGEYGIGSPLTGANIYFKENGSCVIEIPEENFIVNATKNIELNGAEVNLNGDSKRFVTHAELDTALQSFNSVLNSHTHLYAPGPGAPVASATPLPLSSIDISASETQTIKTGG